MSTQASVFDSCYDPDEFGYDYFDVYYDYDNRSDDRLLLDGVVIALSDWDPDEPASEPEEEDDDILARLSATQLLESADFPLMSSRRWVMFSKKKGITEGWFGDEVHCRRKIAYGRSGKHSKDTTLRTHRKGR